jgi:3-deoxy-D-manno-octulosonate 8-phosphate phosphatase (KDO 8-P phosphatase)
MNIRCLVLDVDGVLTDGRLWYGSSGEPWRAFHIHDGLAIRAFQQAGGVVAILTGKKSTAVATRAAELDIPYVIQGSDDKLRDLKDLLARLRIGLPEAAMIGDDLPDLAVLRVCGYPIAVANAVAEVKRVACFVTQQAGGDGAVREAIEHLMRENGGWERVVAGYRDEP